VSRVARCFSVQQTKTEKKCTKYYKYFRHKSKLSKSLSAKMEFRKIDPCLGVRFSKKTYIAALMRKIGFVFVFN
jgi:hypothetical protein